MRKILLIKLFNYLEAQNNSKNNQKDLNYSDYSKLKYDEFLELIKYCRYLLDIDIPGNDSQETEKQLLEYSNEFVNQLMKLKSVDKIDILYSTYNQLVLELMLLKIND